jgi:DNA-binding CsgD family transcriptional regulator
MSATTTRPQAMVVSADRLFRDAAATFLREEGWLVPASEPDSLRALALLGRQPVDVILAIGDLEHVSVSTFKLEVERRWPGTAVVCVPATREPGSFDVGFEAEPHDVIEVLRAPPAATTDPAIVEADQAMLRIASLTPRERTVLQRLGQGMRPAEVAEELGLSRHTVRSHLANLHRKLDVHRRVELIRLAAAAGLLGQGSSSAAGEPG